MNTDGRKRDAEWAMRHEAGTMTGNLACLAGDAQRPRRYEELTHPAEDDSLFLSQRVKCQRRPGDSNPRLKLYESFG